VGRRSPPGQARLERGARLALVGRRETTALLAVGMGALAIASYSALADRLIAGFIAVVLVVVAMIDLERRVIPNRVVLPATAIVLAARIATSPTQSAEWILAGMGAGLVLLLPNLINRSAMGMGDVKLAAFLGAGLGTAVTGALLVAFISVFPFALATLIRGGLVARKSTLPLGPFLAFGGLVILILPQLVGLIGS
jgi:leader peptidase (prepilin peptidase)/N-methyltransferase